jgi:hypothetical protein
MTPCWHFQPAVFSLPACRRFSFPCSLPVAPPSPANSRSSSATARDDIPNGGVLCALPALLAIGLLRHTESHFTLPAGYYPMESIFLLLAYLALGRV